MKARVGVIMVQKIQKSKDFYEIHARLCKSMAHPTRLHILDLLKSESKTVNELAAELGIAQSNLSQHLMIMRESGIVETNRVGSNIYYKVANPKIVEACDLVRQIVSDKAEKQNQVCSAKAPLNKLHSLYSSILTIYGIAPSAKDQVCGVFIRQTFFGLFGSRISEGASFCAVDR